MSLDPTIRQRVAHLYGKTLVDLLNDRIELPPEPERESVEGVTSWRDIMEGPHGDVPLRIYLGEASMPPRRALVWCHGGAWMRGDLDMAEADGVAQRVAADLPGVVVSVDYRLAPAYTHPVPIDDVVAAFEAVADRAIGRACAVDPARVGLGGASAGAHLAACAALAMTDRSAASPSALFLAYPATDPVSGPWPETDRPEVCPELLWFDGRFLPGIFSIYLGGAPADATAIPAAGALERLPPTLITTAEYDALAPQAERFAELARAAGVRIEMHAITGVLHGYLNLVGSGIAVADEALHRHLDWLRRTLGS
jgi:acetyl esterase/lipase